MKLIKWTTSAGTVQSVNADRILFYDACDVSEAGNTCVTFSQHNIVNIMETVEELDAMICNKVDMLKYKAKKVGIDLLDKK
jgi:hypothetical protein